MATPLEDLKARIATKASTPATPPPPATPAVPVAGTSPAPGPTTTPPPPAAVPIWDKLNAHAKKVVEKANAITNPVRKEEAEEIIKEHKLREPLDGLSPPDVTKKFETGLKELEGLLAADVEKTPVPAPAKTSTNPGSPAPASSEAGWPVWMVASLAVLVMAMIVLFILFVPPLLSPSMSSASPTPAAVTKTEDSEEEKFQERVKEVQRKLNELKQKEKKQ